MACHLRDFEDKILLHQFLKSESTKGLSIPVYMAHKLQCEQFMRLKAQNAQYVSSPSDKTVLQNLLVNISIESLEALRHEECLKIALALFQVILLETSKRPIFSSSCSTSSSRSRSYLQK